MCVTVAVGLRAVVLSSLLFLQASCLECDTVNIGTVVRCSNLSIFALEYMMQLSSVSARVCKGKARAFSAEDLCGD